jgi:hypothetical protein
MTIDPDGAMDDWVDLPAGWELQRVPTQEMVTLAGVRAYQEALVDLCATERIHLLVTHPPYDHLDETTLARLRAGGTAVIGYAFDDAIVAGSYSAATRAALARAHDRYVTTLEVPWATRPLPALLARPTDLDAVLVGRAYARRRELVEALRAAGLSLEVRGNGWPGGPVTRREMLELYARAAVVVTTADWEDVPVPMVKHRLLDTAVLGAFQVAQERRTWTRTSRRRRCRAGATPKGLCWPCAPRSRTLRGAGGWRPPPGRAPSPTIAGKSVLAP